MGAGLLYPRRLGQKDGIFSSMMLKCKSSFTKDFIHISDILPLERRKVQMISLMCYL